MRSNSVVEEDTEEDEDIDGGEYDEEEPEDDPDVQDINWFWILLISYIKNSVQSNVISECVPMSPFVFVEMPFCATILISVD